MLNCYQYDGTAWTEKQQIRRIFASAAQISGDRLWIGGGSASNIYDTTDVVDANAWVAGQLLPEARIGHCMIEIDRYLVGSFSI